MQRLTKRGMELAAQLRSEGIPVIESYPGAAQDIVGIARKGAGVEYLSRGLKRFGYEGEFDHREVTHDELDAITCTMVGSFFLASRFEALGTELEDPLIIPKLEPADLPLVIGVSGRIAAGKTTFARFLEANGFSYIRYSQVIDEVIGERGLKLSRRNRQSVGQEINKGFGQRWLGRKLLHRMENGDFWVVDGLRFKEDHSFWREHLGVHFIHIHISAGQSLRQVRYTEAVSESEFDAIDHALVEREIDTLADFADDVVQNEGSIEDLAAEALKLVQSDRCINLRREVSGCHL